MPFELEAAPSAAASGHGRGAEEGQSPGEPARRCVQAPRSPRTGAAEATSRRKRARSMDLRCEIKAGLDAAHALGPPGHPAREAALRANSVQFRAANRRGELDPRDVHALLFGSSSSEDEVVEPLWKRLRGEETSRGTEASASGGGATEGGGTSSADGLHGSSRHGSHLVGADAERYHREGIDESHWLAARGAYVWCAMCGGYYSQVVGSRLKGACQGVPRTSRARDILSRLRRGEAPTTERGWDAMPLTDSSRGYGGRGGSRAGERGR